MSQVTHFSKGHSTLKWVFDILVLELSPTSSSGWQMNSGVNFIPRTK